MADQIDQIGCLLQSPGNIVCRAAANARFPPRLPLSIPKSVCPNIHHNAKPVVANSEKLPYQSA